MCEVSLKGIEGTLMRASREDIELPLRTILEELSPTLEETRGKYRRRIIAKLRLRLKYRKRVEKTAWFKAPIDQAFDALLQPQTRKKRKPKQATVPEIQRALQIVIARLIASNEPFDEERIRTELHEELPQNFRRTIFDRGWYKKPVAQALKMQPFVTLMNR